MTRRTAAVVLALALNPALVRAQDTVFTVNVPSAEVFKGPSNVTPVIGHVPRGTVLPVSRNLGSWLKIAWPEAPDGVGYVHVTMGHIAAAGAGSPAMRAPSPGSSTSSASSASSSSAPAQAPSPAAGAPAARASASQPVVARRALSVIPAPHTFGIGGLVGTMSSYGATARTWPNTHVGIQIGFTRDAMTSTFGDGRVTSIQFEPGVMYGFFDHVSDYIWIRPYVGSVVSFRHQTLTVAAPVALEPVSDNGMGFRFFGGSELMFASAPRFGLSADLGYRRFPTPFPGFEADPLSVTIAGHWYVK